MRFRERFEEPAPGGERVVTLAVKPSVDLEPEQGAEMRLDTKVVAEERVDRRVESLGHRVGTVALERTDLGLDDLGQRGEAAATIGERAAMPPRHELGLGVHVQQELVDETTLPEPGSADQREELRRTLLADAVQEVDDEPELPIPPDQRGGAVITNVDTGGRPGVHGLPDADRLRLPLGRDRRVLEVVDPLPGGAVGRLA